MSTHVPVFQSFQAGCILPLRASLGYKSGYWDPEPDQHQMAVVSQSYYISLGHGGWEIPLWYVMKYTDSNGSQPFPTMSGHWKL